MSQKELVNKLKSAIIDYQKLIEEQNKQAEQLTRLVSLVRQLQGGERYLEQQFETIKTHDDLCSLDEATAVLMIPLAINHIANGLKAFFWNDQDSRLKSLHAVLFLWDCLSSRRSIFQSLSTQSLHQLEEVVLNKNFSSLAEPVLTSSETCELQSAVRSLSSVSLID